MKKIKLHHFALAAAFAIFTGQANASANQGDELIEEAKNLWKQGSYSQAFACFKLATGKNNTVAQYFLGVMYFEGKGVKTDTKTGKSWMKKSADGGDVNAMADLASRYFNGQGVKESKEKSFKWSKNAAENNHAYAKCNYANMLFNGEGCEKNIPDAIKWYEKAVEDRVPEAQYSLGLILLNGRNVEKDIPKGIQLIERAANSGLPLAQMKLAALYYKEQNIEQSKFWFEEAAPFVTKMTENGKSLYQNNLGFMHEMGLGVKIDINAAIKYYKLAASSPKQPDSSFACLNLWHVYTKVLEDKSKATEASGLYEKGKGFLAQWQAARGITS